MQIDRKKAIVISVLAGSILTALLIWALAPDSGRQVRQISLTEDGRDASLQKEEEKLPPTDFAGRSTLSGRDCPNGQRRPLAVMYSGDPNIRDHFTHLSKADIVVEMPHRATHGGTRIMALFQCESPEAVGPLRSGRVDFINFAAAFDAIFVPWGGSGVAKSLLKRKVIDVIDCNGEVPPAGGARACFRRTDNGFDRVSKMNRAAASVPELLARAEEVGYRLTTSDRGLKRQADIPFSKRPEYGRIRIGFEGSYRVDYYYDRTDNSYKRFFNKKPDIDYATGEQIKVKNVVVIPAKKEAFLTEENYQAKGLKDPWVGIDAQQLIRDNGQYPNFQLGDPWFDTVFEGPAFFYLNGREIKGKWKKQKRADAPFEFYAADGSPIYFVEGSIWIEIPERNRKVRYYTQPKE